LGGSHDKINGAPRQLVRIWPTEGHRLNRRAVQREGQACMAAIPYEAHRRERNLTQKEGGLGVPHPSRCEVIRERGKVNWRAAADRCCEIHCQLWCARLGLTGAGGTQPRKKVAPRLRHKRATSRAIVAAMSNQQITRLLQSRRYTEALWSA
jgi:hypothetical protein